MENMWQSPKLGKGTEYLSSTENFQIILEQIKEVMKADTGRKVRAYNSCY